MKLFFEKSAFLGLDSYGKMIFILELVCGKTAALKRG